MEAALLLTDVVGILLVLLWAARGRGTAGLFAWRPDTARVLVAKRPSIWLAGIRLALWWAARGFGLAPLVSRKLARRRAPARER